MTVLNVARTLLLVICCFLSLQASARCTDTNFIRRALAYNGLQYIKINYLDSLGNVQVALVNNQGLFEHLFKEHGYFYKKCKPFMFRNLQQGLSIPYDLVKDLGLINIEPNKKLEKLAQEGVSELLHLFETYKWSGYYKKNGEYWTEKDFSIDQVITYLFDYGVLTERIEEYWFYANHYACDNVPLDSLRKKMIELPDKVHF